MPAIQGVGAGHARDPRHRSGPCPRPKAQERAMPAIQSVGAGHARDPGRMPAIPRRSNQPPVFSARSLPIRKSTTLNTASGLPAKRADTRYLPFTMTSGVPVVL